MPQFPYPFIHQWTLKLFFELFFCVCCKRVVEFHSFACDCPVFPKPFIEETLLTPLFILGSFVIN